MRHIISIYGLDKTDQRILEVLQSDARIANVDLAQKVNLSPSPCLRRVRRLEELGYVRGYVSLLDSASIGLPVSVFVQVSLEKQVDGALDVFERQISDLSGRVTFMGDVHLDEEIRNFAYSYLEKYSPSKQQLKTYLFKKLIKKRLKISSKKEIFNLIDSVISSLVDQKLLSDAYYSDSKSKAFLRRGYSLNKIRNNLIKKGIDEKYVKASISKIKENESDPDFFSAIKLCKKKRIGPSREEDNRPLFYKKDISILARSGFSYELSKKILAIPKDEFKKFCRMM